MNVASVRFATALADKVLPVPNNNEYFRVREKKGTHLGVRTVKLLLEDQYQGSRI